ncbi:MAG: ABC transporter substrate-binding protein [Nanoarchaeota archaeon]
MNKTLLLLLTLSFLITACGPNAQTQDTIKFGAVLPLTGSNAFYGNYAKAGITLATEDINQAGGINGKRLEIVIEDSGGDKARANLAVQKLIDTDQVQGLFTVTTPMSGVLAPVAESSHIPLVYNSATISFAEGKRYVFKDYSDAAALCEMLMKQALKDGHTKIALLGMNGEFSLLCKQGAERIAPLLLSELYDPGETDFRTPFVKITASGATALVISTFPSDCPNIIGQMQEINFKPQLYLPFLQLACGSKDNTKKYPSALTNAYGADIALMEDSQDPDFVTLKKRLEERSWTTQMVGSAMHYDDTMLLANAWQGCNGADCVADNLRKVINYKGPSGTLSYNGGQIIQRKYALTHFEDGKWTVVS